MFFLIFVVLFLVLKMSSYVLVYHRSKSLQCLKLFLVLQACEKVISVFFIELEQVQGLVKDKLSCLHLVVL